MRAWIACLLLWAICSDAFAAPITVTDDAHHELTLAGPAQRIVSLAPHTTELLFAIGAGSKVVGVSQYSDYPAAAKQIASVGGSSGFDLERIAALKPDLVVLWTSGTSTAQVAKLRQFGIAIYESEPHNLDDIASSMERLGKLAGTAGDTQVTLQAFRKRREGLANRYAGAAPVSVFYQIWHDPLMTLNDAHLTSSVIALCGGQNVFGKLAQLAPTVNTEAVIQANPEVILTGSDGSNETLLSWRKFPQLLAVKRDNLFALDSGTLTRGSPRILDGADELCERLDQARKRRVGH